MMETIIFICTGNTCRSPMASAMFRACGGEEKTGLQAMSAGMFAMEGMSAAPFAIQAAAEFGGDLTAHKARVLTAEMVDNAGLLICMTAAHYDNLVKLYPDAEHKTFLLMNHDVPDPFGGSIETYRTCAAQIRIGIEQLIERLSKSL